MQDVLALCASLPAREVPAGGVLIAEGERTDTLYVLESGAFEVLRHGVRIIAIQEPGAFMGEISAVLASAPTASVVATRDSRVRELADASAAVQGNPELTYAIAQLLARRLLAVTAYLADIKRQYDGSDTHLAVMDQVLANLMAMQPGPANSGSERGDVPPY